MNEKTKEYMDQTIEEYANSDDFTNIMSEEIMHPFKVMDRTGAVRDAFLKLKMFKDESAPLEKNYKQMCKDVKSQILKFKDDPKYKKEIKKIEDETNKDIEKTEIIQQSYHQVISMVKNSEQHTHKADIHKAIDKKYNEYLQPLQRIIMKTLLTRLLKDITNKEKENWIKNNLAVEVSSNNSKGSKQSPYQDYFEFIP